MRVIAGKLSPTAESIQLSSQRLGQLADVTTSQGIRLMTENWFGLTADSESVTAVLDNLDGRVGLCLDFGNWVGEDKYNQLATIAPYAESCHAKAQFDEDGLIDGRDYAQCLEITAHVSFQGPYTLIYDNAQLDEWAGLAIEKEYVLPYITG